MFTETCHNFIRRVPPKWRWTIVTVYTLSIYAFLPFAANLWAYLLRNCGKKVNYLGVVFAAVLGIYFLLNLILKKRERVVSRYIAFFFISLASIALFKYFCVSGSEQFHLLMYGVLSAVVFWAMKLHVRTNRIYIYAILLVFLLGTIDEFIQMFLPSRVFDVRDIYMNWVSASLGMLFLVFVIRSRPLLNVS